MPSRPTSSSRSTSASSNSPDARTASTAIARFTPETQTEYEERYRSTLYKERGLIQATPVTSSRHNIPMMFQYATVNGQPQVLVLRDIAGEHLKSSDLSASMFRFFTRADGIIYLIDPLQNRVRKARFSMPDAIGLLTGLGVIIE